MTGEESRLLPDRERLNSDKREQIVNDVDNYHRHLFKWFSDGIGQDDLNPVECEGLVLEYYSLLDKIDGVQQNKSENGWSFENGLCCYDDKDLNINGHIDDVIMVDQSPIGRTPRSNPITYVNLSINSEGVYTLSKSVHTPLNRDRIKVFLTLW